MTPEEFIAFMDEDDSCNLTKVEVFKFLEKWAKKKNMKVKRKTKKEFEMAWHFLDDNHDGKAEPSEVLPALREGKQALDVQKKVVPWVRGL